ncbi:hypothetical protein ACXYMO_14495 [Arenibacterium sp. CAU 1754]
MLDTVRTGLDHDNLGAIGDRGNQVLNIGNGRFYEIDFLAVRLGDIGRGGDLCLIIPTGNVIGIRVCCIDRSIDRFGPGCTVEHHPLFQCQQFGFERFVLVNLRLELLTI